MKTLENVTAYELLPYHPMGLSKAAALGMEMKEFEAPSSNQMEELKRYADLSR